MKYRIEYSDNFEKEFKRLGKKYRSLYSDLLALVKELQVNPIQGAPLGNHCYKIRMAISSKGKGKSAGARVITHIHIAGEKVYLLSIYDKSAQSSITDAELKKLLAEL